MSRRQGMNWDDARRRRQHAQPVAFVDEKHLTARGGEHCSRCHRTISQGVPIVIDAQHRPRHRRDCQP